MKYLISELSHHHIMFSTNTNKIFFERIFELCFMAYNSEHWRMIVLYILLNKYDLVGLFFILQPYLEFCSHHISQFQRKTTLKFSQAHKKLSSWKIQKKYTLLFLLKKWVWLSCSIRCIYSLSRKKTVAQFFANENKGGWKHFIVKLTHK